MKTLREAAAYLRGAHAYESAAAVDEAADWRERFEDLTGQRGVKNISAMLEIIGAAIYWTERHHREGGTLYGADRLIKAVDAYEDMVKNRKEEP